MSDNTITTLYAREQMAKARAGESSVTAVSQMAFGAGGVDGDGNPVPPTEEVISLSNELLRKTIDGYEFPVATTVRYQCTLGEEELADETINEIALVDSSGELVAVKTMKNKVKDADMEFIFEIDDRY